MCKIYAPLAFLLLFAATVRADLPPPVIHRDATGTVTITSSSPTATIFYSLNGSDPDVRLTPSVYLGPFYYPYKGTIKARAIEQSDATVVALDAQGGIPTPPSALIPIPQGRGFGIFDWPKRHEAVCALVRERKPDLIFIGDSITHFMGGDPGDKTDAVWHEYYEKRNAVNMGFAGDKTENVLWRLQNGELEEATPKVAVVLIGTNNLRHSTPEDIAAGIQAICAEIRKHAPQTKILLLGVFPRNLPSDPNREKIKTLNGLISRLDGQNGITYLDIGSKFLNPDGTISTDVMADLLHPTPKGYQIWAAAMEPTLKKLLGE
jgi:lysophospholipase L1-like esterase